MAKDINKTLRGSWWYGWVRYTYYDYFTKSEREGTITTDYDFATSGQAKRAADALAGGLAAPEPVLKFGSRYHSSKNDRQRASKFNIIETGASRVA